MSRSPSPTPSTSPSESTLGASLQCPVCYEMFGTRIFQCSQGHSVCDRCYPKIPSRQCPQCRSNYMGTRNYILEEMIKTLKMLKSGAAGESDAKKEKKASKSAEAKLTDEIAKLVNMIPSVEEVVPEPTALIEIREGPSAIELLRMAAQAEPEDDDGEAEINALSDSIRDLPSRPAHAVAQPGGLFNCRMLGCNERVPVCRMLPHIRSLHADHLAHQAAVNNDFVTQFSFPYATYRRALHIPRFGLFFLIVNVKRENVFNQITAWVQVVGRREQCRHFSYELNLRVGNRIATYKDFTYGDWSDTDTIQEQGECLLLRTNQVNTTRYKEIEVTLSISKMTFPNYAARSSETRIQEISRNHAVAAVL